MTINPRTIATGSGRSTGPVRRLLATTLLALTPALAPPVQAMNVDLSSCRALVGTYVTAIADREGVFSSRGLMSFTADGLVFVADSSQGGVPEIWDAFSGSQGTWVCRAADDKSVQVAAVALNFTLPGDGRRPAIGRVDYEATLESASGTLAGKAMLSFTEGQDLEAHDPVAGTMKLVDEFQFDAQRVTVKPK